MNRFVGNHRSLPVTTFLILLGFLLGGCGAYFNTFYNARKLFNVAEKKRIEQEEKSQASQQSTGLKVGSVRTPRRTTIPEYDKAIEKCSKVLELYPNSRYVDDAIMIIGQAFYHKGEYLKARRKFEELVTLLPNSPFVPQAKLWLGKTLIALREFGDAQSVLQGLIEESGDEAIQTDARMLLGDLYLNRQDYEGAIQQFRVAAEKSKDHDKKIAGQFQLASCLLEQKKYQEAAAAFKHCLDLKPALEDRFVIELNYAQALRAAGQYSLSLRALEHLRRQPLTQTELAIVQLEIARTLVLSGEEEKGRIAYEDVIENNSKKEPAAIARYELAKLELEDGRFKEALEQLELAQQEYNRSSVKDSINYWKRILENWDKAYFEYSVFKAAFQNANISGGDTTGYYTVEEQSDEFDFSLPSFWADQDSAAADSARVDSLRRVAALDSARADSLRRLGLPYTPNNQTSLRENPNSAGQNPNSPRGRSLTLANPAPDQRGRQARPQKVRKKVNVPRSPTELRKKLLDTGNQLAEMYFFQFQNLDSALVQYAYLLDEFLDHARYPQWLYASSYIYDQMGNHQAADSLKKIILSEFPDSEIAIHLANKMGGKSVKSEPENPAAALFRKAENLLFNKSEYDSSLAVYNQVVQQFPESEYAPKALFSIGYIYDWIYGDTAKAAEVYRKLIKTFPNTEYAKRGQEKLLAVQKLKQEAAQQKEKIQEGQSNQKSVARPDSVRQMGTEFDEEVPVLKEKNLQIDSKTTPKRPGRGDEIADPPSKKTRPDSLRVKGESTKKNKKGKLEKDWL